jgi:hypothetical protein
MMDSKGKVKKETDGLPPRKGGLKFAPKVRPKKAPKIVPKTEPAEESKDETVDKELLMKLKTSQVFISHLFCHLILYIKSFLLIKSCLVFVKS